MKNIIEYYYNLKPYEIHQKDSYYFFNINNIEYILKPYYVKEEFNKDIYMLNNYLLNRVKIDKIILNNKGSITTIINNKPYILINKVRSNTMSLMQIANMANLINSNINNFPSLERNDWEILWENKIDYYEEQIGVNEKKYPLIRESFDYFIGLSENAISYLVNTKREITKEKTDYKVLSHNNLYESIYDPSNIILDHSSRDLAEYIKLSFFNNNINIFKELNEYFYYNYYSIYAIRILFARILYPSYYFNLYDEIISGKKDEKALIPIINKINNLELYLLNIYNYLNRFYNIPKPEWLK